MGTGGYTDGMNNATATGLPWNPGRVRLALYSENNIAIRRARIARAKVAGRHTRREWQALLLRKEWSDKSDYRNGAKHNLTPERIKGIRTSLDESTVDFGQRFFRSGRTVEDWEQGRRTPDPIIIAALVKLAVSLKTKGRKRTSKKSAKNPM